jgi:hypothetical protein
MAAPTNAAYVKKALANSEPSTDAVHMTAGHKALRGSGPDQKMKRTNGGQVRSAIDVGSTTAMICKAAQHRRDQTNARVEEAMAEKI